MKRLLWVALSSVMLFSVVALAQNSNTSTNAKQGKWKQEQYQRQPETDLSGDGRSDQTSSGHSEAAQLLQWRSDRQTG